MRSQYNMTNSWPCLCLLCRFFALSVLTLAVQYTLFDCSCCKRTCPSNLPLEVGVQLSWFCPGVCLASSQHSRVVFIDQFCVSAINVVFSAMPFATRFTDLVVRIGSSVAGSLSLHLCGLVIKTKKQAGEELKEKERLHNQSTMTEMEQENANNERMGCRA